MPESIPSKRDGSTISAIVLTLSPEGEGQTPGTNLGSGGTERGVVGGEGPMGRQPQPCLSAAAHLFGPEFFSW